MNTPGLNEQQLQQMRAQPGFVAALDQSGGSTPKALEGLSAQQSDSKFNAVLAASIQSIFEASTVKQPGWQQGRELKAA